MSDEVNMMNYFYSKTQEGASYYERLREEERRNRERAWENVRFDENGEYLDHYGM